MDSDAQEGQARRATVSELKKYGIKEVAVTGSPNTVLATSDP